MKRPTAIPLDAAKAEQIETRAPRAFAADDIPELPATIDSLSDAPPDPETVPLTLRRTNWLVRLLWTTAGLLVSLGLGLAADALIRDLFATNTWLGWVGLTILALFVLAAIILLAREIGAVWRLRSLDHLKAKTLAALRSLDLLDNPLGVILPQAAFGLPMTIIILRGFFRQIPGELEEAATLDGCSSFGFFWRVLLPMARPALGTVSVLAVVTSWNNFFLPLLVFTEAQWWTLPNGVQKFQGQYSAEYAKVFAYLVLAMVPALAFYSVAERQLVGGLTAGATKG